MNDAVHRVAQRLTGSDVLAINRYPGGDISGASEVRLADGRVLVAKHGPVVDIEGRMLQAMSASSAPVPDVLGCEDDVLLIECLPDDGPLSGEAWSALARALTSLQEITGDTYGWAEDYALRHVTVANANSREWPSFWAENRLLCHAAHLDGATGKRLEALSSKLKDILPDKPRPALLHGDMWGGNVLVSSNRISGLIDPCAYYGHAEVDVATLTVFDSPTPEFFEAMQLETGWQERQPVYRLWTWLLHVRLFGYGYLPAVERELASLGF